MKTKHFFPLTWTESVMSPMNTGQNNTNVRCVCGVGGGDSYADGSTDVFIMKKENRSFGIFF